jgi:hypothetical protein
MNKTPGRLGMALMIILALFVPGAWARAAADDTEAAIAAGGIRLLKDARISMEKERLIIGEKKVIVEYEFLNETDKDIAAEVAFPVPYFCDGSGDCGPPSFADFRVWIEGTEVKYSKLTRAFLKDHDYSDLLTKLGVDAASYGHFDFQKWINGKSQENDITRLSEKSRQELIEPGLIDTIDLSPKWNVEDLYHWTQAFPARKIVHVRHEYQPQLGYMNVQLSNLLETVPDSCVDPGLEKKLSAEVDSYLATSKDRIYTDYFQVTSVNFILTTANNWKTPIRDFELLIEKSEPLPQKGPSYVSLCWDGKITRLDERHFVARKTNFIPKRELAIYFFTKEM